MNSLRFMNPAMESSTLPLTSPLTRLSSKPRSDSVASSSSTSSISTGFKLRHLVVRKAAKQRLEDPSVSLENFKALITLGTGTFGRVQLIQERTGKQQYFALKSMKKKDILKLKQVDHIMSEIAILDQVAHPFVVNLIAGFQDSTRLFMILEYVPGGELFGFLRREKRVSDSTAKFFASEIVLALHYLHERDIAYRDLKPENLLLSRTGHLKIADFGFAKKFHTRTWTLCGTPEYLAPEIIQSKGHGKSVDWWALGILVYEMLAGYPPFFEENPLGIYKKILRGVVDWPTCFDSRAKDFIARLLVADVTKRLGCLHGMAEDVAYDAWFSKVDWQATLDRFVPAPFFPPIAHGGDTSNFDEYDEEREDDAVRVTPEEDLRLVEFGSLHPDFEFAAFLKDYRDRNPRPTKACDGVNQSYGDGSSDNSDDEKGGRPMSLLLKSVAAMDI